MESKVSNTIKKFRLGELFCGQGGLALGAIHANISDSKYRMVHQWANDYDLDTCQISQVIRAIRVLEKYARGTIRISSGVDNTIEEIEIIAQELANIVNSLYKQMKLQFNI